jgi:hypothetical protein
MTDRALVIGLDRYDNEAWELRAAVRDALAFAKWVTADGAGRATKDTLTLLLSPHPDRPVNDVDFQLATEDAIKDALIDHETNGGGAGRLWFFYAGHGIAPAGGGPDQAPVIVPADVKRLERYRQFPIELGVWIRRMQVRSPQDQVYFVDACRGLVVSEDIVTATTTLFFDLSKVPPAAQARQAVLLATTAGQLANEQGLHGLFGGALIDGLYGKGPELKPDVNRRDFVLTFGGLAEHTKRRIQAQSEVARRANKTLPTQEPAESLFRVQSSLELARFPKEPSWPVKVFVEPDDAKHVGTAGIFGYNKVKRAFERYEERRSPLTEPIEWDLPSTVHTIEIEAQGFKGWSEQVDVSGPVELQAELIRLPVAPVVAPKNLPEGGVDFESFELPGPVDSFAVSRPAGLEAGKQGKLKVDARDRYARIEVFDVAGTRVATAWGPDEKHLPGQLEATLPAGSYRVEVTLPTERPVVQRVLVTADKPVEIDVRPDPQLTQRLPASTAMIAPRDGVTMPSERFGPATTTHLGSVLAWAAWAAQFPADGDGNKLRALGVEPLPPGPGQCFVRLLVGDAGAPAENRQGGPIETLVAQVNEQPLDLKPVPALQGFAVQGQAQVPYQMSLTVQADGLDPKRIPLPFVADHVWTVVIVRESTQLTEIHRYLQRLQPQRPFDDTIRLVEQNWRALESRTPLYDDEVARLLDPDRDLDPLGLAVLGYRLAREDRQEGLSRLVALLAQPGFAGLPDVHVLASLVGERDKNMARAVNSQSAPVVSEGYRLMEAWLADHFGRLSMPPPSAREPLIGGLWTTFDTRGQAVISKAFPVRNAPAWAALLLPAANATARIEAGPEQIFVGTGFLIGPRALATSDSVAKMKPRAALFGDKRVGIGEIVGATNDDRHGALARIEPADEAPLKVNWALPAVGTRIAVIGHPRITFTPTLVTLHAFETYPAGEKMIMPGVIVAVEKDKLTYECWTMAGVSGGPILDLATGEVIGIHHSGRYEGGAKKLGFGVPVTAIKELLETPV